MLSCRQALLQIQLPGGLYVYEQ